MGIHYCLCVWDVWFHVNCIDVFGISAYLHKYSMLNRQRETKRNRFAQICGWAVNGNTCLVQGHCWHRFHYFLLYLLLLLLLYFLYLSFWFCYANCLQFHSALSICGVHLSVFSFIPKYCLFNHNLDPQKKMLYKILFPLKSCENKICRDYGVSWKERVSHSYHFDRLWVFGHFCHILLLFNLYISLQ